MLNIVATALVLFFLFVQPAHAYIDAGTGSLILQALLGGIVGFSAFIKIYWLQVKIFFARFSSSKETIAVELENTKEEE